MNKRFKVAFTFCICINLIFIIATQLLTKNLKIGLLILQVFAVYYLVCMSNQNIGVFGLGKTGISVFEAMKDEAEIIVFDDSPEHRELFARRYGNRYLVDLSDTKWQYLDRIVLSPGVSCDHEIVRLADTCSIPIISDIDLLFEKSQDSRFIAVTGTNGKSTVTALISHILNANGYNYPAAGNIGIPALQVGVGTAGYVLELSSFQLSIIKIFTAKIAILLNITPDHLDVHKNMAEYIAAKYKIFDRMEQGTYAVINIDDQNCFKIFLKLQQRQNIKLIPISVTKILEEGVSIVHNKIYDTGINFILPFNRNLQGIHNHQNFAASYVVSKILGLSPLQILESIKLFKGLPHRMQYIGRCRQIDFYNDSKATNAEAAVKSIGVLDNIYWLAGGISKKGGIENISSLFYKIKKAYFFGQAKADFASNVKGKVDFAVYDSLHDAVQAAFNDASKDKIGIKNILLAPACSSYDQFINFEQRGEVFTKLCLDKMKEE